MRWSLLWLQCIRVSVLMTCDSPNCVLRHCFPEQAMLELLSKVCKTACPKVQRLTYGMIHYGWINMYWGPIKNCLWKRKRMGMHKVESKNSVSVWPKRKKWCWNEVFGLNRVRMIVESSYFRAGEMEGPSTGLRCDLQRASYLSRWARGMVYKRNGRAH